MSDLEALWRAVLASPDEDTPRLMYADEIQEADPDRAELIRAQCEIARLDYPLPNVDRSRWEPVCVACGGAGKFWQKLSSVKVGNVTIAENVDASFQCRACSGSGRQPCRWERGFPVVQVAEMRHAWEYVYWLGRDKEQWQPTPWLCGLLRTHHVAGVELPAEYRITRENVPPRVWELLDYSGHIAPQFGRAVVLAALEWLDAQGAM